MGLNGFEWVAGISLLVVFAQAVKESSTSQAEILQEDLEGSSLVRFSRCTPKRARWVTV